jgi:large subunit ribosomal protein L17
MKHKIGFNRLSRKPSHRKALLKSLIMALFTFERITTTKAKALAARQEAEKMITRAKVDSVHNRRIIGRRLTDEGVLAKLFVDIGPRFEKRPGGYTRILKLGQRYGDAAEMVILELVDRKDLGLKKGDTKPTDEALSAPKKAKISAEAAGEKKPRAKKVAKATAPTA